METDIVTNMPESVYPNGNGNSNNSNSNHMWKYIIIVLVLALLGFNLFTYFGQLTKMLGNILDHILNIFRPILAYFGYGIGEVTKKTINLTADTLTGGINVLEKGLKKPPRNFLKQATNAHHKKEQEHKREQNQPLPDEAGSLTQGKGTRKAGFCYIGEDRGFRSCINVGEGDECMSGDIFPTRDQCINPNLRSG